MTELVTATSQDIEFASRDRISTLQLERMQWSLMHAYTNVPHYRKAFDDAGVHPSDLKDLSDLAKFPFTTKADLRENYPFKMFAVPQDRVSRIHASSGTTGRPTVVGYTSNDLNNWADLIARSLSAGGVRSSDKVHVAYGYGLFTGGLGAHYGAERLGCTVIPMSGGMTERQIQLIEDFEPDAIMVTPSYMLTIVDAMIKKGIDPSKTSLRVGVFGAEPWTEQMRTELEQQLDMHAVDIYGLSEIMGPGVAMECVETKDGLHIWEDHFYPEIIDPVTGEVLPDGEEGELVFTSLTKEALPHHSLPNQGPDPTVAGYGALDASDAEGHRPDRRHGHPAWGQSVPHTDRRADPDRPRPGTPIPVCAGASGPDGYSDSARRGSP